MTFQFPGTVKGLIATNWLHTIVESFVMDVVVQHRKHDTVETPSQDSMQLSAYHSKLMLQS